MSSSANNNNTPRPAVPRARRSTLRSLKRAVSHSALANLFHSEPAPPTPLIPGAFAAQQPNSVASPKKSLLPLAEPLHHTQQALTPPESPRPQPQPQSQPKVESVLELPRSALTSRKPYALPEPFLPRSMAGHDRQTRALPAGFSVVAKTKVPTAPDAAGVFDRFALLT